MIVWRRRPRCSSVPPRAACAAPRADNLKSTAANVDALVRTDPATFRNAWGGTWLGVDLARVDRSTLRELPGPDRTDYWLARLERPLRYARDDAEREIRYLILASRYVEESIRAGIGRIVVGIAYVLDDEQTSLPAVDMSKCLYAAIGEAEVT